MKKWGNTGNNILSAIFMIACIALWEAAIRIYQIPNYLLPSPSAIIKALNKHKAVLWEHTQTTLFEAVIGLLIAIVLAVFLALIMNRYGLIKQIIYPVLVVSQTIPIIALAPLLMVWLGFGILPKIVIVVLICFFPISVSVTEGLAAVDQDLVNLLKSMKATPWQIFVKVELPASMPSFFSGLKISATYSIMGAVIAEWIGAKSGLGIFLTRAMNSHLVDAMFADILIIVVVSVGLFQSIQLLGKKIMPWNKERTRGDKKMFKRISRKFLMVFIISMLILSGCTNNNEAPSGEEAELRDVTVTLDWTPNTNHTGLYVAKDKGFYEEMGLNVEIVQPAGGTSDQVVAADTAQFGISYQESVTFARLQEVPIVSIAAVIQHNTSGFASIKSKGIKTPKDFEGKKYGGWGSPVEVATLKALMEKYDADYEKVEILTSGAADFFASSEMDIDFAWIFEGWTGVEAQLKGIELDYVDLGKEHEALDYYTPVIITNEKNINEDPEFVRQFMKATAKGYEYAIQNPEEAADILSANAPELNEELVKESQKFLSTKYQDDAEQWGVQKEKVWQNYTNWLYDNELIESKIDVNKAYTNDFLPE